MVFLPAAAAAGPRAPEEPAHPPLQLEYHLVLDHPNLHLVTVEITAGNVTRDSLDFAMPAWAPGRYAIYDFAKNVQEFEAFGPAGQALAWTNSDKQTWRVEAGGAGGTVKARYRVFANDLGGSFSQFDSTHANLNGPSIFMYVAGHKADPLTLAVEAPRDWQVVSGFSDSTAERLFQVPNYDRLVDTPLELSGEVKLARFEERGKPIRVAVHAYEEGGTGVPELTEGLKKIVHAEMAWMPAPDFGQYTFIIHFAPDLATGDGMEHLNSTQIIVRGSLSASLEEALETAAHEFFHLWNVKRLRPVGFGPFDYTREVYTPVALAGRGCDQLCQLSRPAACRVVDARTVSGTAQRGNQRLRGRAWAELMSAESSSFHAWFYDRAPQMQETNFANTTISYYNKGALVGLLLDLEIRRRSEGAKSLFDVLSLLYRRFYETPAATYYGPGRGYEEQDILAGSE